jgi:hypothetical protein
MGRDSSVGIAACCGGRLGDRIPEGGKFYAPVQVDPGVHLASYTVLIESLSRGKTAGALNTHHIKRRGY